MKTPRAPGTAINTQRLRRWVQDFAGYRHQVTEGAITDWLAQFKQNDRDAAARVLDAVDFYSVDRISAAFKSSLQGLPGWDADGDRRTGKWRFAALARSAGESGDAMMHRLRVANGLDRRCYDNLFIHPSQILLQELGADDTLVLVDDFVGTGKSVCTAWSESFSELTAGIGHVYLLVVVAASEGISRIHTETQLSCVPGIELEASDNFFAEECHAFTADEKVALLSYCRRAKKSEPRGFGACGLVLVFQHRCPNNSLPILHAEHERWIALFPRQG